MTTVEAHRLASGRAARTQGWWAGLLTLRAAVHVPEGGPMKRFLLVAAAMASVLLLGVSPAGANQPAMHFTQDGTGDMLQCGDTTYTVVSGAMVTVVHEGQSASGNTNFTSTITPRNVVLQDQDGNLYSVGGAVWFGGTFNANTGGFQGTSTDKLQIVSQGGGTVDSVNGVEHVSPNGKEFLFSFGTCEG
jgi:hypothetical protein